MSAGIGRLTQALWGCFTLSLVIIALLAVRDYKRGPRIRMIPVVRSGPVSKTKTIEKTSELVRAGKSDPAWHAGKTDQPMTTASGPTPGGPGTEAPPGSPPGAGDPSDPIAFVDHLLEILKTEDLDGLLSHGEPGFVRAVMPFLEVDLFLFGKMDKLSRIADSLQVDLEEAPGDRFRLHLSIEGKMYSGEDFFLIPHEESWRLAAESDLPGPLADRRRTVERLRLLGLARLAYLDAGLGGPGFRYAETARELQHGLERSSAYAGIFDPGLAAAVDDGRTLSGYRFGRIGAGPEGFAYIASPAAYGPESRETFIIDSIGRVWARDLGGEPPPSLEGSADLDKSGWIRVEGPWPRF
jgi:hypothetical protein